MPQLISDRNSQKSLTSNSLSRAFEAPAGKCKEALAKLQKSAETQSPQKFRVNKSVIPADPKRSLVSADFDAKNRLVLKFDDKEELITRPLEVLQVEQHIGIKQILSEGGGTTINVYRPLFIFDD